METITVPFRCSRTGRPFRAELAREDGHPTFRIRRMRPGRALTATIPGRHAQSSASQPAYRESEIDWSGWHCLGCDYAREREGTFVHCPGCNELVCGATLIKVGDGIETFTCHDDCGSSGRVTGFIAEYHVEPDASGGLELLPGPVTAQLAERKRLPPPG